MRCCHGVFLFDHRMIWNAAPARSRHLRDLLAKVWDQLTRGKTEHDQGFWSQWARKRGMVWRSVCCFWYTKGRFAYRRRSVVAPVWRPSCPLQVWIQVCATSTNANRKRSDHLCRRTALLRRTRQDYFLAYHQRAARRNVHCIAATFGDDGMMEWDRILSWTVSGGSRNLERGGAAVGHTGNRSIDRSIRLIDQSTGRSIIWFSENWLISLCTQSTTIFHHHRHMCRSNNKQESCAIAKMTARCALYK